jgi:chromosome segregation ATPase
MVLTTIRKTMAAGGMPCILAMLAGCAFSGPTGHTRPIQAPEAVQAVTSIQDTRVELVRANQQVDAMVAVMDRLASAPENLPQVYKAYVDEVYQTTWQAEQAQQRAERMRTQWQQYISAWENELGRLSTPELQARATQRSQVIRENYERLRDAARAMQDAYQPFITQLRDIQRVLSLDLTPAGVEVARPAFDAARKSAANVKERIEAFVLDIDDVASRAPRQPASAAAR